MAMDEPVKLAPRFVRNVGTFVEALVGLSTEELQRLAKALESFHPRAADEVFPDEAMAIAQDSGVPPTVILPAVQLALALSEFDGPVPVVEIAAELGRLPRARMGSSAAEAPLLAMESARKVVGKRYMRLQLLERVLPTFRHCYVATDLRFVPRPDGEYDPAPVALVRIETDEGEPVFFQATQESLAHLSETIRLAGDHLARVGVRAGTGDGKK